MYRTSENAVTKLSEKPLRCLERGPTRHPNRLARPVLARESGPNARPERHSDTFSDGFKKPSENAHERAKRLTIKRVIAT
jgi:hypothetical protein